MAKGIPAIQKSLKAVKTASKAQSQIMIHVSLRFKLLSTLIEMIVCTGQLALINVMLFLGGAFGNG